MDTILSRRRLPAQDGFAGRLQANPRPAVVSLAVLLLVAAFAIPPIRAAIEDGWTERVRLIAIVVFVLIVFWSIGLLRAWRWVWWLTVLGLLLEVSGLVFDFIFAGVGPLAPASQGLDSWLLGTQYVFELAVLMLLLPPKSRQWFRIGVAAERSTGDVA